MEVRRVKWNRRQENEISSAVRGEKKKERESEHEWKKRSIRKSHIDDKKMFISIFCLVWLLRIQIYIFLLVSLYNSCARAAYLKLQFMWISRVCQVLKLGRHKYNWTKFYKESPSGEQQQQQQRRENKPRENP